MSRINLAEIHEQFWFPEQLRDHVTDALEFILGVGRVYEPIAARLANAIEIAGAQCIVDLCSGAGGPWIWLHRTLEHPQVHDLTICLTDKYPNIAAFERARKASHFRITYCSESIDAARIPEQLKGFRTIFSSFHHFSPTEATAILQDAVDGQQGIGIFEGARRGPVSLLLIFLMPLAAIFTTPFIRPFRLSRLFWTYLIPVIPFVLWFDGILSCLRAYLPSELSQMVSRLKAANYKWEIGEVTGKFAPVTYLLGYPTTAGCASDQFR